MSVPLNNEGIDLFREIARLKARLDLLESMESAIGSNNNRFTTIWFDENVTFDVDWHPWLVDPNQNHNFYIQQSTPAIGNEFEAVFEHDAGVYNLSVLGVINADCGQITWSLDGVDVIVNQDWYNASLVYNTVLTSSVTVATSGTHTLRGVVSGINGSSSNYLMALTKAWLAP